PDHVVDDGGIEECPKQHDPVPTVPRHEIASARRLRADDGPERPLLARGSRHDADAVASVADGGGTGRIGADPVARNVDLERELADDRDTVQDVARDDVRIAGHDAANDDTLGVLDLDPMLTVAD